MFNSPRPGIVKLSWIAVNHHLAVNDGGQHLLDRHVGKRFGNASQHRIDPAKMQVPVGLSVVSPDNGQLIRPAVHVEVFKATGRELENLHRPVVGTEGQRCIEFEMLTLFGLDHRQRHQGRDVRLDDDR